MSVIVAFIALSVIPQDRGNVDVFILLLTESRCHLLQESHHLMVIRDRSAALGALLQIYPRPPNVLLTAGVSRHTASAVPVERVSLSLFMARIFTFAGLF